MSPCILIRLISLWCFSLTLSHGCASVDDIISRNKADWSAIHKAHPRPGALAPPSDAFTIGDLFYKLRYEPVNLVVMVEVSASVGFANFFLRLLRVIQDLFQHTIRRYRSHERTSGITVGVVSVGEKSRVLLNYTNSFDEAWNSTVVRTSSFWDSLPFEFQEQGSIDLLGAFQYAEDMLHHIKKQGNNAILLFSSGSFSSSDIPNDLIERIKTRFNASVYTVLSGEDTESRKANLKKIASIDGNFATDKQFRQNIWNYAYNAIFSDCGLHCKNGGFCYYDGHVPRCWCPWGFGGDTDCQQENECLYGLCGDMKCIDKDQGFSCECSADQCGCLCDQDCAGLAVWVIVLICLVVIVLVAVLVLVFLVVLVLRKLKNHSQLTHSTRSTSHSRRIRGGIINQIIIFFNLQRYTTPSSSGDLAMDTSSGQDAIATVSKPTRRTPPPVPATDLEPSSEIKAKRHVEIPLSCYDISDISKRRPKTLPPNNESNEARQPKPRYARQDPGHDEDYEEVLDPKKLHEYLVMRPPSEVPSMVCSAPNLSTLSTNIVEIDPGLYDKAEASPRKLQLPKNDPSTESPRLQNIGDGYEKAQRYPVPRPPSRLPDSDIDIIHQEESPYENMVNNSTAVLYMDTKMI